MEGFEPSLFEFHRTYPSPASAISKKRLFSRTTATNKQSIIMYKHNHIQKRIVHSYIRTIFKFIAYTTLSLLPQSRLRNPLVPFAALKGVTCYACKGSLHTCRYVSLCQNDLFKRKNMVAARGIEPL